VPEEVDVLLVMTYYAPDPAEVERKRIDVLPGWVAKAKGRPLLLEWNGSRA